MSTASTDNWTETNCLKLIREFRARPTLWDNKDPFYYKKSLKPLLWEEIGKKLDMPALDCKHKMNILMSSFRREKAKLLNKLKENGETSENMCIPWFAFNDMMFMMDKESERKRQKESRNVDSDNEEWDESTTNLQRALLSQRLGCPTFITSNKRPRPSDASQEGETQVTQFSVRDATTCTTSSKPKPQPQPESSATTASVTDNDDEIKSFVNFITFKMKKYSETTKNKVQQAICDVIFKADQKFYENKAVIQEGDHSTVKTTSIELIDDDDIKEEYDTDSYNEENID